MFVLYNAGKLDSMKEGVSSDAMFIRGVMKTLSLLECYEEIYTNTNTTFLHSFIS